MTKSKHNELKKAEEYARALLNAAKQEGRTHDDLVQWKHVGKFSPEVFELIVAMHKAEDLDLVHAVEANYKHIVQSHDNTVFVTVTTAVPLDDDLRERVREHMSSLVSAPVFLVERIDPSILGGIIIEEEGNRWDASVKSQMSAIRRKLRKIYSGSEM